LLQAALSADQVLHFRGIAEPRPAKLRGLFLLFDLRHSVPLYLFHQGGPNALDQSNAIRVHGQELLGRIDPGFDQYD